MYIENEKGRKNDPQEIKKTRERRKISRKKGIRKKKK